MIGKPYLVQRAKFKDTPVERIVGIDSLLELDYMGSAEFEFGALPKSLRAMVARLDGYGTHVIGEVKDSKGNALHLYCHKDDLDQATRNAVHLSKNPYGYKEYCDMIDYIAGNRKYVNDFWWDIEGHYMMCFGKDHAHKVEVAMQKLSERWSKGA